MVTVFMGDKRLKPCSPAIARKLLRSKKASRVYFGGQFAIRLLDNAAYEIYAASFPEKTGDEGQA